MKPLAQAYHSTTLRDLAAMEQIARRYCGTDPRPGVAFTTSVDLMLIHHITPLDLDAMLDASDHDLWREIVRLRASLDRQTGELAHYRPRFAREGVAA